MTVSPSPSETRAAPSMSGATEALYRAALGPGDVSYYLRVFGEFDERGLPAPRWNTAAGLLGLVWLIHRHLWRQATVSMLLGVPLALALWWWARESPSEWTSVRVTLGVMLIALSVIVPGFWGNAWLHSDVRERMTWAVRRARTVQEACGLLELEAPRQPVLRGLGAVGQTALLALLIWPLWQRSASDASSIVSHAASLGTLAPTSASGPGTTARAAIPQAGPGSVVAERDPRSEQEPPLETMLRPRWQGFGVNVGMFADPGNAQRVEQRLSDAGLPVVVDPVESARGTLARVRVGPFDDMLGAEVAAAQVRALGLEARVFGP